MCKKEQKQANNLNKNLYNKVLLCTMISTVVVVVLSLAAISYFCIASVENYGDKIDAVLLDAGLSIIGIAISVWAGLNIINALEKKDIDEVQETLRNTKEKVEKLSEDAEEIEIVKNEQQDIYKGFFLQELLKTNYDAMSRYFYKFFSECESIGTAEYVNLVLIEQYFSQVYLQYSEKTSLKSLVLSRAHDGIKLVNDMYNQYEMKRDSLLEKYLLFRKYEFNFLMGYLRTGVPKYESFIYAAEGFAKISNKFGVNVPCLDREIEKLEYTGEDENLQVAVYFMNTLGEAYSKIIEETGLIGKRGGHGVEITKETMIGFAEKAVAYLEIAVKWNQRLEAREVYYRNLGCAYERMDRVMGDRFGSHADEIISNYRKAFQIVISNKEEKISRVQNIYHTLLSYYERYMRVSFKSGDKEKSVFEDKEGFSDFLGKVKERIEPKTKEYLVHYQRVSEIAVMDNARFSLQRNLNGFSWTWILVLLLSNDQFMKEEYANTAVSYMERIKDILDMLEAMNIEDAYCKELKKRYGIINSYLINQEE